LSSSGFICVFPRQSAAKSLSDVGDFSCFSIIAYLQKNANDLKYLMQDFASTLTDC